MKENIEKNLELSYFIYSAPITQPTTQLIDQIEAKFGSKLKYSTVLGYRNNLPHMQKRKLEQSRKELLSILRFVIDNLKDSIERLNESDNEMRIELTSELRDCIKQYNELLQVELTSLQSK
jgi:hypothetical protein